MMNTVDFTLFDHEQIDKIRMTTNLSEEDAIEVYRAIEGGRLKLLGETIDQAVDIVIRTALLMHGPLQCTVEKLKAFVDSSQGESAKVINECRKPATSGVVIPVVTIGKGKDFPTIVDFVNSMGRGRK